ncbi:MAG TPA: hypothetical protein VLG37_05065 [Candidatus Saccharimonadales bacterium]|nr:hypothetical protein [Candidatus Saccharimonadales bacterium]
MKSYLSLFISGLIITVIFGTIYGTVQQSLRLSANDPQIQLAEDSAAKLDAGAKASTVSGQTDIKRSLATFLIIYDKSGRVVAGTGRLDGQIPRVPLGVLKASEGKDYHAVTWQPQNGVRLASVTVSAKNYYVVSARSLKEVEKRETKVFQLAVMGWLVSLLIVFGSFWWPPNLKPVKLSL